MSNRAYYESLPKKRMGAGVIFFNDKEELLLVKPTYKEGYILIGGTTDKDESPRTTCIRESKEELGLEIGDLKLVLVDYYGPESEKSEYLYFIFYGGVLSDEQISSFSLQEEELSEYRFVKPSEASDLLTKKFVKRLPHSLRAIKTNGVAYLEQGEAV